MSSLMLAIYPLPFFTNHNTISLSFGGHGSCRQACCSRRERVSIRPLFPSPPNQCTRAENLCDEAPEDSRIPTTRIQRKLLVKRRQLVADNLTLNYLSLCVLFNTVCKQVQFLPGASERLGNRKVLRDGPLAFGKSRVSVTQSL